MKTRCAWTEGGDENYITYHDEEWAVPVHDDRTLFEFIVLESAQAGLSWRTILNRRDGYRRAFRNFDPHEVARMDAHDVERLLCDASIIRNRNKIESTIQNAQSFLTTREEWGSFDAYLWDFVKGKTIHTHKGTHDTIPSHSELSIRMAHDLKRRGFRFLGPTIMYAYMQAIGIVNDHTHDCFRYEEIKAMEQRA